MRYDDYVPPRLTIEDLRQLVPALKERGKNRLYEDFSEKEREYDDDGRD